MEQKPSIGRIVHFGFDESFGALNVEGPAPIRCVAAIITEVLEDRVKLRIFHPAGLEVYNIPYPYSEKLEAGHWTWPPKEA